MEDGAQCYRDPLIRSGSRDRHFVIILDGESCPQFIFGGGKGMTTAKLCVRSVMYSAAALSFFMGLSAPATADDLSATATAGEVAHKQKLGRMFPQPPAAPQAKPPILPQSQVDPDETGFHRKLSAKRRDRYPEQCVFSESRDQQSHLFYLSRTTGWLGTERGQRTKSLQQRSDRSTVPAGRWSNLPFG